MKPRSRVTSDPQPYRPRGIALLLVVGLLAVVSLLAMAMLRASIAASRQQLMREHEAQASWLLFSGHERAHARLAADPDYSGETWSPSAVELGGRYPADVVIRVEPGSDPGRRVVHIQADFPRGQTLRARRRGTFQLFIPQAQPGDRLK